MQRLFLLLILFLCVGCATVDPGATYKAALATAVRVDDESGMGSGVVINQHCIVTAKHVTNDKQQQKITTQDGKEYDIVKYYLHEFSDLAVACVNETLAAPPVRIRHQMPDQYASIFVIGNPLGVNNILTTGNYQGEDNITAPIAWGNSGGGVYDNSGSLIGIVVAIRIRRVEQYVFAFPHLAVITTIRDIVPFLNEHGIPFYSAE